MKQKAPAAGASTQQPLSPALRAYLIAASALTGAIIMIVEILGAKLLAPYIGTSHFVWTAQIGVTLVSLAIGYAVGGKIADRSHSPAPLFLALLAASLVLTTATLIVEPIALACLRFSLPLASLLASTALFFIPLALLAITPPFLIRALTLNLSSVGSSAGRLSAISTIGSVAGTTLIGYLLIPFFPNSVTMLGTSTLLSLSAILYFLLWNRKKLLLPLILFALGLALAITGIFQKNLKPADGLVEIYRTNSNFGLLQVVDAPRNALRYYLNDLLTQNIYHVPSRQSAATFTHMLHGLSRAYTPEIRDALCIGMGVGIVPAQLHNDRARVTIVEINPSVVPLAQRYFHFNPSDFNLVIADGRTHLATTTEKYDAIILDAFLGDSSPTHLMTREAFASMKKLLRPNGTLVINAFGSLEKNENFLSGSLQKTLETVFPFVRLHAIPGHGNLFYVASLNPGATLRAPSNCNHIPAPLRSTIAAYFNTTTDATDAKSIVLTDDYNPTDYYDSHMREQTRRNYVASLLNK